MGAAGVAGDGAWRRTCRLQCTLRCVTLMLPGMGRAHLRCHICNVHDVDSGHLVQVRARDDSIRICAHVALQRTSPWLDSCPFFYSTTVIYRNSWSNWYPKSVFSSPCPWFHFLPVSPLPQFCTRACPCKRVWVGLQSYLVGHFGARELVLFIATAADTTLQVSQCAASKCLHLHLRSTHM